MAALTLRRAACCTAVSALSRADPRSCEIPWSAIRLELHRSNSARVAQYRKVGSSARAATPIPAYRYPGVRKYVDERATYRPSESSWTLEPVPRSCFPNSNPPSHAQRNSLRQRGTETANEFQQFDKPLTTAQLTADQNVSSHHDERNARGILPMPPYRVRRRARGVEAL